MSNRIAEFYDDETPEERLLKIMFEPEEGDDLEDDDASEEIGEQIHKMIEAEADLLVQERQNSCLPEDQLYMKRICDRVLRLIGLIERENGNQKAVPVFFWQTNLATLVERAGIMLKNLDYSEE